MTEKTLGSRDLLSRPLISSSELGMDPYNALRSHIDQQIGNLKAQYLEWRESRLPSHVLLTAIAETRQCLQMVDAEAVLAVSKNRRLFPHINDDELDSRRAYIDESSKLLNEFDTEIRALPGDQRNEQIEMTTLESAVKQGHRRGGGGRSPYQAVHVEEKEQGQRLDQISAGLDVLHEKATDMNEEITAHNTLLETISEDVEMAQRTMDKVNKKLGKLLNTSDRCQTCTCVILSVILVVDILFVALTW